MEQPKEYNRRSTDKHDYIAELAELEARLKFLESKLRAKEEALRDLKVRTSVEEAIRTIDRACSRYTK